MDSRVKKRFIELEIIENSSVNFFIDKKSLFDDSFDLRKEFFKQEFKQEYLGNFVKPTCSVYSINQITKGKSYCPDEVEHYIEEDGKTIGFCRRCFLNYKQEKNLEESIYFNY